MLYCYNKLLDLTSIFLHIYFRVLVILCLTQQLKTSEKNKNKYYYNSVTSDKEILINITLFDSLLADFVMMIVSSELVIFFFLLHCDEARGGTVSIRYRLEKKIHEQLHKNTIDKKICVV